MPYIRYFVSGAHNSLDEIQKSLRAATATPLSRAHQPPRLTNHSLQERTVPQLPDFALTQTSPERLKRRANTRPTMLEGLL
jgi:hypothetical protein